MSAADGGSQHVLDITRIIEVMSLEADAQRLEVERDVESRGMKSLRNSASPVSVHKAWSQRGSSV